MVRCLDRIQVKANIHHCDRLGLCRDRSDHRGLADQHCHHDHTVATPNAVITEPRHPRTTIPLSSP